MEEVDTKGWKQGKKVDANKTITIYPRIQLFSDIQLAIAQNRILHITKKGEHLFAGVLGSNPQGVIRKDILNKNISYFWANVKWLDEKNKILSATEPILPASGAIAFQKALDEKYMKAVKKGDMDTAQRMVDEAAKATGYD